MKQADDLQCIAAAQVWRDWWKLFWGIGGKLRWRPGLSTGDLWARNRRQVSHGACGDYDDVVLHQVKTLEKGRDDLTVHQRLDVVFCAHCKAAEYHGALNLQLHTGGALLQKVQQPGKLRTSTFLCTPSEMTSRDKLVMSKHLETYLGTAPRTIRLAFCLLFPMTAFFMSLQVHICQIIWYMVWSQYSLFIPTFVTRMFTYQITFITELKISLSLKLLQLSQSMTEKG